MLIKPKNIYLNRIDIKARLKINQKVKQTIPKLENILKVSVSKHENLIRKNYYQNKGINIIYQYKREKSIAKPQIPT